jgi:hypothetical protein
VLPGDPVHGIDYFFIVHCSCHGGSIARGRGEGIRGRENEAKQVQTARLILDDQANIPTYDE